MLKAGAKRTTGIAVAFAAAALTSLPSPTFAEPEASAVSWKRIGTDLERAEISLTVGAVFKSSVVLIRSNLERYTVRAIRAGEFGWKRSTIRALCRTSGATACINANFFDEQGKALGLVMSRGIIHQKAHKGGGTLTAILYVTPHTVKITHRDGFSGAGAIEAVQAGPRLIAGGEAVQGIHDSSFPSNFSGACIDTQGRFILFRVTSGVFGCSTAQLQETLLQPSIGCVDAINFDGGGSSQMYVTDTVAGNTSSATEELLPGVDTIPVALGLFETSR